MATLINKAVGKIVKPYIDFTSGKLINDNNLTYGLLNKAWRAKLLIRQKTSTNKANFQDAKADAYQHHVAKEGYNVPGGGGTNEAVIKEANKHKTARLVTVSDGTNQGIFTPSFAESPRKKASKDVRNTIAIINYCVSPYQSILIQTIPQSVEVEPSGDWVAIKSMGRNNPFMMYTGGEDTIKFEVDWYIKRDTSRESVIRKCKLLESWTRADGYNAAPPILKLRWGNTGIYDRDSFVLVSAAYKLNNFQNAYFKKTDLSGAGVPVDLKLFPNCATQELVFKRVSTKNRAQIDIIPASDLALFQEQLTPVNVDSPISPRYNPAISRVK